jgi:L-threonylcarbamoyladenylate synthase
VVKVLKVDPVKPDPKIISTAARAIKEGLVIVYPTETVYGIGTNALDPKSVLKIFRIKERPLDKALPIAVSGPKMAEKLAFVTEEARKLMREFWPGPLTIILKKKGLIPMEVTGGGESVGLRAPGHAVPLSIMKMTDLPLIATSANKHNQPNPETADEALTQIGEVDLVLDAGKVKGVPSTVIDLTKRPPVIIRDGPIPRRGIEELLKPV